MSETIEKIPKREGRVQTDCGGESRTKQAFKKECDVNFITRKYQKAGIDLFNSQYVFGEGILDASGQDFTAAQMLIANARSMFEKLPSSIRNEFENDPAKFLDFANNPENQDKMVKMGLAKAPEGDKPPVKVELVGDQHLQIDIEDNDDTVAEDQPDN
jgi:hypothetical protein